MDVQADALTTLAVLPDEPPQKALAALRRAVQLAEEGGFLAIAARANHNLGYMTNDLEGDLRRARDYFQRSLELSRRRGSLSEEINPLMSVMGNSLGLGEIGAAEALVPELASLVEMLANPELSRPAVTTMRAFILMMKGDIEDAQRLLREVQAEVRQRGDLQMLHNVNMEMAGILMSERRFQEVPDWSEVEAWLHEAIHISNRGLGSQIGATSSLAAVRARQGQFGEAARLLQQAREHAATRSSVWHETTLLRAQVELDIARRHWSQALANLELKNYQAVADATGEIISSGAFQLEPDFYELFKIKGKLKFGISLPPICQKKEKFGEHKIEYDQFGIDSDPGIEPLWMRGRNSPRRCTGASIRNNWVGFGNLCC